MVNITTPFKMSKYTKEFLKRYPNTPYNQVTTVAMFAVNGWKFNSFKNNEVLMDKGELYDEAEFISVLEDGEVR